jgi:hypothetical protein
MAGPHYSVYLLMADGRGLLICEMVANQIARGPLGWVGGFYNVVGK